MWDAYLNVRDLGGLRCAGGVIRSGALVRASTLGSLTPAGSVAIRAHGVIVADYCASDVELADEYARFRSEHPEVAADMAERQARRAWVIGQLLTAVRAEHADAAAYLERIGVLRAEIERLREMLVV